MINLINVEGENEKLDQPNPENGSFLSTDESESGERRLRIMELINCSLFDILLPLFETGINSWMVLNLASVGQEWKFTPLCIAIIVFALLGSLSTLFLYSWQSYSYMIKKSDQNFRVVSNCFRMVHAYISSAPLMLINLSILMNETKGIHNQEPAIDLRKLPSKMKDLNFYGSAIFLPLFSFLRGVSIFNERETKIILFAYIALPMSVMIVLCRITILAIIVTFAELIWSTILIISLVIVNSLLIWITSSCVTCKLNEFGNIFLISLASIIVTSGYSNDEQMYHPKIKGGLYLILNHLVTMALMGVTLAYTMKENHMPNKIYLSFPRMKMLVDVSDVNVNTTLFGSPISLTIKGGTIDVGKLSEYVIPMGGGLDIPPNFYILLPCILTALCLPLVITRAVMMDLDCFVFKKSQLFVQTEKYVESQHQLPKILQKNINSKKITCRLNIVLLCSTFVNLIVVLLLILFGILIFMVLSW